MTTAVYARMLFSGGPAQIKDFAGGWHPGFRCCAAGGWHRQVSSIDQVVGQGVPSAPWSLSPHGPLIQSNMRAIWEAAGSW